MKERLKKFWISAWFLWRRMPRAAQIIIVIFTLIALAILILSPDRQLWLFLCGLMLAGGLLAGWVIYRLLFPGEK